MIEPAFRDASFDTRREDFAGMIRVVWWAVGGTTATGLFFYWVGWLPLHLPGILASAAALQLCSWTSIWLARRVKAPLVPYFAAHLVNILLVTLVIFLAGGISFLPGPLFYALIVVNGGIVGRRPAHALALFCALAYGMMTGLDVFGILPAYRGSPSPSVTVERGVWLAQISIVAVVLQVSAAYAARLTSLIRTRGDALRAEQAEKLAESERLLEAQLAVGRAERDAAGLRDLTDRYRAFVQIATHDLQPPINAIYLTALHLLADPALRSDDRLRLGLEQIRDIAGGAEAMVFDLMNLFRILAERENPTLVSLEDAVNDATRVLASQIEEKGVFIEVGRSLPVVWGHPGKIQSVVTNLMSNAVKYVSRDGGSVRVSTRSDGSSQVLVVEDNGIGVPPEYRERIFELFARLPDPYQEIDGERVGGSGVGLALVRRIMELHGGSVTVADATPAGGARFELRFPEREAPKTRLPAAA